MTNDRYLIVSYFLGAASSGALGTLVYLFLRRPFGNLADAASSKRLPSILKRLFPVGLVFPALLGFVSVFYMSCSQNTYDQVIQDRKYLVERNQQQISLALLFILVAVLLWDLIILFVLKSAQPGKNGS
jgi:hypothetical protein